MFPLRLTPVSFICHVFWFFQDRLDRIAGEDIKVNRQKLWVVTQSRNGGQLRLRTCTSGPHALSPSLCNEGVLLWPPALLLAMMDVAFEQCGLVLHTFMERSPSLSQLLSVHPGKALACFKPCLPQDRLTPQKMGQYDYQPQEMNREEQFSCEYGVRVM